MTAGSPSTSLCYFPSAYSPSATYATGPHLGQLMLARKGLLGYDQVASEFCAHSLGAIQQQPAASFIHN